jgi:hypothetical protein
MQQPTKKNPIIEFILGIILTIALHVIVIILSITLFYSTIALISVLRLNPDKSLVLILWAPTLFIGVTQIIYLAPLCAYFTKRGRNEVGKGIILGAIVTLLVNSSCFSENIYDFKAYLGIKTYHSFAQIVVAALLISATVSWLGVKQVQRSRPSQD